MTAFVRAHPFLSGFIGFFLLVTVLSSFAIVPETRQGIVVRFGKPVRIINRYTPGQPFGSPGAGIAWRIPFAEDFVWIDKRVRDVDMEKQQVLSTDSCGSRLTPSPATASSIRCGCTSPPGRKTGSSWR